MRCNVQPSEFWHMGFPEIWAIVLAFLPPAPPGESRAEIAARVAWLKSMMARYPDQAKAA